MNWPGSERWVKLWESIRLRYTSARQEVQGSTFKAEKITAWYEVLTKAYAEPQRQYHNQRHIADCLAEFDSARRLAKQPEAVELALWFHDAVYDPKAADNEEQSAALAKQCLDSAGQPDLAETVGALVMAIKAHQTGGNADAALMVDVDLSILGQDEKRFDEYEAGIRAEYAWVPEEVFTTKRAEILQRFLDRERIYATEHFFAKYERQARKNLERSIRKLKMNGESV